MSVTVANSSHVNPSMTEVDLLRIIATNITTIAANPSGPVYQTSTGGNGAADSGKLLMFGAHGEASCSKDWHVEPNDAGTAGGTIFLRDKDGVFTARIRPTDLTDNRQFTIPDAGGTWALLEVANVFTAGQTIQPASAATCLTLEGGTVTTSNPLIAATQTWNDAGVAFSAFTITITNTASGANSLLMDLQVGGSSLFNVGVGGNVLLGASSPALYLSSTNYGIQYASSQISLRANGAATWCSSLSLGGNMGHGSWFIGWNSGEADGATADVRMWRDEAAVLAVRNSTTAQTFRLYRTYTDASNYERATLQSGAGYFEFAAQTAGTGTDDISVRLTPSGAGVVEFPGGTLLKTVAALTDGAAAQTGTLTNAPSAGNPTKWIPVDDNGTTRYIPAW